MHRHHKRVEGIDRPTTSADVAPLRLSFTGTLRVIRRALPKFQRLLST